ncbi:MAG: hypothetical protein J6R82_07195 [Clostridia bacterium]|nr:hypothetical protein [Clostridia bacterium]
MAAYSTLIEVMDDSDSVSEKAQIMSYLIQSVKQHKPTADDLQELSTLAYRLVDWLMQEIPAAANYKAKDDLFNLEDKVLGLLITMYGGPERIPGEQMAKIRDLVTMVRNEQV